MPAARLRVPAPDLSNDDTVTFLDVETARNPRITERRDVCDDVSAEMRRSKGGGTVRLDQMPQAITIRIATSDTLWELTVPDVDIPRRDVRITLHEVTDRRGSEASTQLTWNDYTQVRDWLRCIPDGHPAAADIEPSLTIIRTAFGRILDGLSTD